MKIMYLTRNISVGGISNCIQNLCKNQPAAIHSIVCAYGDTLKDGFHMKNIDFFQIPDIERKNPYIIFKTLKKIRTLIKKENINLIHSHHRMTTLLSKIAVKGTSTKVIHTQHLNIQDKYYLTRIALSKIPTICVSRAAKKILIEKSRLDPKNIFTIYNTIDEETDNGEIDPQIIAAKKAGNFVVVQVSRLVTYKGVFQFLDIAEQVTRKNNLIKFFLIGDGPERKNLHMKIKELGLENIVFLLGTKVNVLRQLKEVNLMLLCSTVEGLPLAPLEAFYSGIPVIGSDIDGIREEIEDGDNGYLVSQRKVNQFAEKILFIVENPKIYYKMKLAAKKTFNKHFTKDKYMENHQQFYKKVMDGVLISDKSN